jgi:hypothetical protein
MFHMPAVHSSVKPFTANQEYVGIDKIRIIYPLDTELSDGSSDLFTKNGVRTTIKGTQLAYAKGSIPTENGGTIYFELRNNGTRAVVEFNPARVLDLHGDTLCSVDKLVATVVWAIKGLSEALMPIWCFDRSTAEITNHDHAKWPPIWRSMVEIMRLDAARDIYCPFQPFGVSNLMHIKKTRYSDDVIYRNSGIPQTLVWGKALRASFYNKSLAHHKDAEGGWHRFELQVKTAELKKRGMRTLEDITEDKVHGLLWERWDLSNMSNDLTIATGLDDFKKLLLARTTAIRAETFMGIAASMALGLPIGMNSRIVTEYRKMGEELGFSLGSPFESFGTKTVHIDFAQGIVVDVDAIETAQELTLTAHGFAENMELQLTKEYV